MNPQPLSRRCLLLLLGSVAFATLPHVNNLPVPIVAFFLLLIVWRALGIRFVRCLPDRLPLFLLTLSGIALLATQLKGVFGRDPGTALIVVTLGLKLMEIRGRRDAYLIVFLAFIVAASQFLYAQTIALAAYVLVVTQLLLATLVSLNSSRVRALTTLKTAGLLLLQAAPLALVIFVFFPRLEAPHWMWLKEDNKALSGLSNSLEPGSISDLSLSDQLVFRVRFDGELPPARERYWRGPVYTHTDGVRWTIDNSQLPTRKPQFSGKRYQYTVLMEPQRQAWVFGLDMPESFDTALQQNADYQLTTSKLPGERAEYRISSGTAYNTGDITEADFKLNTRLPAVSTARQLQLVKRLQAPDANPEILIQNLLQHFRTEAFYYTLTPPLMLDNPIEQFLFETRRGFCSHYATAFVYLLRIAGIPARVVGGYQGGEFNKVGGFLEIRQADAHAWTEVWLKDKGWVRFDPSAAIAPDRIEHGVNVDLQIASGAVNFGSIVDGQAALSWLKRSQQLWQSIDYNWQRWVINYNVFNQKQFLQSLGIDDISSLVKWWLGSLLGVLLPMSWWLLKAKTAVTDQAVLYYRRFLGKLARAGIQIQPGEGAQDFSARAVEQRPDLAGPIRQITALFMRLRYQALAGANDLAALKKAIARFRV